MALYNTIFNKHFPFGCDAPSVSLVSYVISFLKLNISPDYLEYMMRLCGVERYT